jgi:hypothetical protein
MRSQSLVPSLNPDQVRRRIRKRAPWQLDRYYAYMKCFSLSTEYLVRLWIMGDWRINMFVLPVNHEYHGYVDLPVILLYRGALSGMEMTKRFPTICDPLQAKMHFLVLVLKVR